MYKKDNIAGALEGNVHIPRVFPQRDGLLLSSTGFVMWAMAFILAIVAVISARSEAFSYEESAIKMFITGFAGLVIFYIAIPLLFVGSIYVLIGRKSLSQGSRASVVTGFVFFQILLFITLISTPTYYGMAVNSSAMSSNMQTLFLFLETLLFVAWFLMLVPFTPVEKRNVFITGFVLMMVPLAIFTFIAFISTGIDSFFLSPIPLYMVKGTFYTTVSAVLFWVFQSTRQLENDMKAVTFIRKRPPPATNAEDNMTVSPFEEYPDGANDAERYPYEVNGVERYPDGANDAERYPYEVNDAEHYPKGRPTPLRHPREFSSGGIETPNKNVRIKKFSSLFSMKEDHRRTRRQIDRRENHEGNNGRRYEW